MCGACGGEQDMKNIKRLVNKTHRERVEVTRPTLFIHVQHAFHVLRCRG